MFAPEGVYVGVHRRLKPAHIYSTYKMAPLCVLYILLDTQFILAAANTAYIVRSAGYIAMIVPRSNTGNTEQLKKRLIIFS